MTPKFGKYKDPLMSSSNSKKEVFNEIVFDNNFGGTFNSPLTSDTFIYTFCINTLRPSDAYMCQ